MRKKDPILRKKSVERLSAVFGVLAILFPPVRLVQDVGMVPEAPVIYAFLFKIPANHRVDFGLVAVELLAIGVAGYFIWRFRTRD